MAVQIKICGIREDRALEAVIEAKADFGGFIFHQSSPRNLTISEASRLTALAEDRIQRVGLMVNPNDDFLCELAAHASLDAVQLQGSESPERVGQIRELLGVRAWKAIAVASREDILRAEAYADTADFILFDAKTPPGALPGGMGLRFDWNLLKGLDVGLPWGLAGGLNADNVAEAIRLTRTPLVDVCSGTEAAPGIKDVDKIAAFCKAAREA
ncbi:phosphoribosylanthranilate isomerase [uncultured Erythrobacter sp.]|uniref:phosphoribosylanthranilate isomerase n=1 Tax=uncultured Erythrobacter sp. TaxID=263913 RepID=UPI0026257B4D|nr:phosphoribosylanthranilate isomerase [uncultured Erythrobacter sp.]